MKPVRITLSRKKGFRLQELSRSINGLECVKVSRPGKWGNPYQVGFLSPYGKFIETQEDAVSDFRILLTLNPDLVEEARRELRGKNLACWCRAGTACHADVLLEMANREEK
jgi:hypothetical protein